MKKKIFLGVSIAALMLGTTACGGSEEESSEESGTDSTAVEEVVEAVEYSVDTAASMINWTSMDGEEVGHTGSAKLLSGTYTVEGDMLTAGQLTVDMNSIMADNEKLTGHLMSPEFFDVNQFATASFNVSGYEEGIISGVLNVAGQEIAVDAPATITDGMVEVSEFKVDMGVLPWFISEREEAPEEEWHNPNIAFTATIVGTK